VHLCNDSASNIEGSAITYVYPLLACLEVYLWPPMPDTRTLYPYNYWWPWYRPYWWRPYPFRRF